MKIHLLVREAIANILLTEIQEGSGANPKIEIYGGTMPTSVFSDVTGQTILAELEMSDPAFTVNGGVLTLEPVTQDLEANATGTATWLRILNRSGTPAMFLTVSATGGGGDLQLNTVELTAGGPVSITGGSITVGGE